MSAAVGPALALASPARLAVRNLLQDRLRFVLSVAGVGLSLMLIAFLLGLREGALRSTVVYLENTPGSLLVLPAGVKSTAGGTAQFLPPETAAAAAETPGVARVTPVLLVMGFSELHGRKEYIKLVGYDASLGGGPWALHSGRQPAADDEVVLDRVIANRHRLEIGDTFELGGRTLTITGLSRETSSWTGSYAFARKAMVESLVLASGASSFLLVTPERGTPPDDLAASLSVLPGTTVLPKREVMANDREIVAGIFDRVILVMVTAAFVVGALIVGMVVYAATNERRAEFGVLKALGASAGVLYRVVSVQALAAAGIGAAAGVAFAFGMGWLVESSRPQFVVVIEPPAVALTVAAGLVMALAGALIPARAAAGLAPAEVFRR